MKQLLIEVDQDLAERLDRVAPARSRQRSDFVRNAIRKALWELEETLTARAYAEQPDSAERSYFDARVWEAEEPQPVAIAAPAPRVRRKRKSP